MINYNPEKHFQTLLLLMMMNESHPQLVLLESKPRAKGLKLNEKYLMTTRAKLYNYVTDCKKKMTEQPDKETKTENDNFCETIVT